MNSNRTSTFCAYSRGTIGNSVVVAYAAEPNDTKDTTLKAIMATREPGAIYNSTLGLVIQGGGTLPIGLLEETAAGFDVNEGAAHTFHCRNFKEMKGLLGANAPKSVNWQDPREIPGLVARL